MDGRLRGRNRRVRSAEPRQCFRPSAATGAAAASLAAATIDKTAGTCANTPTHNSLGGSQFETSCSGEGSGGPEYWCAVFVQWVRRNSGFHTGGSDAGAAGLHTYGRNNGTLHTSASYRPAAVRSCRATRSSTC
ncbi:hypothetical protein KNE206_44040 [Kitasatospora sp. NE20-6]